MAFGGLPDGERNLDIPGGGKPVAIIAYSWINILDHTHAGQHRGCFRVPGGHEGGMQGVAWEGKGRGRQGCGGDTGRRGWAGPTLSCISLYLFPLSHVYLFLLPGGSG